MREQGGDAVEQPSHAARAADEGGAARDFEGLRHPRLHEANLGQPGVRLRPERFRGQPHQRQHRIAHRAGSARKREGSQVGDVAQTNPVDDQSFSAPDGPVVAEARPSQTSAGTGSASRCSIMHAAAWA